MSLFLKSSPRLPSGKVVLLSIKPKYADLILAGSKQVEFRRTWSAHEVSLIVLYASSPVQMIVGVVSVKEAVVASPTALWKICTKNGGGLTRKDLRSYFAGKREGVAVMLRAVFKATEPLDPKKVISDFVPPQSFRYLSSDEYEALRGKMVGKERK